MYLLFLAQHANTFAPVKSASAAIHTMHKLSLCEQEPTAHPMVCLIREASHKVLGGKLVNQKEPLDFEVLQRAASKAVTSEDFILKLSVALAVRGFTGFFGIRI